MNTTDRLVLMANQIAANLAREPDPAAATAHHIRLYWDPRMKTMIRGSAISGLTDVAAAAVAQLENV